MSFVSMSSSIRRAAIELKRACGSRFAFDVRQPMSAIEVMRPMVSPMVVVTCSTLTPGCEEDADPQRLQQVLDDADEWPQALADALD